MEEGVVRMAAQMYGLVAQIEAVKARIEAMKVCNTQRDEALYDETHFFHAETELEGLSKKLIQEF